SGSSKSTLYHARRNQGSARRLIATNGILHLLVRGSNTRAWDPEYEEEIRLQVEQADRWLQNMAADRAPAAHPTFVHKYVTLRDESFWRSVSIPDSESASNYRESWLQAVLVRFGVHSYRELFNQEFGDQAFDNRAVVFHTVGREGAVTVLRPHRPESTDV